MQIQTPRRSSRVFSLATGTLALCLLMPAIASAQYSAPDMQTGAVGEKYHVEAAFTLWTPSLFGVISSEQFGIVGDRIDTACENCHRQYWYPNETIPDVPSERSSVSKTKATD